MASAALLADTAYMEVRPGRRLLDRFVATDAPRFVGDTPLIKTIETGLTDDLMVKTSIPANPNLIIVLTRLHELKLLGPNWDGCGASAIVPAVFKPALDLAVEAITRCALPTLVPLADGGIGLRLTGTSKELELDVLANGKVDILCDGDAFDNDIELEAASLAQARNCLHQYCRA